MLRRNFVRNSAAVGLTAALSKPLRALPLAEKVKNGIGLQVWTVRNEMEADLPKTLKAIADAGYRQVELGKVIDSGETVKMARDLGMEVRSSFFNWESIANPNENAPSIDKIIEEAKKQELEYLVFGYIGKSSRDTADKLRKITDTANMAAEKIATAGMKMSYHNHSFEFEPIDGEKTGFDIFMERFEDKINFELDVFWAAIGGWDPVDTLKKLGKRVGQVHLKDLKAGSGTIYDEGKVPNDAFQEVGDGILDMNAIMEVALANGVEQFHVEQDQSPDPIASIQQSQKYVMKNLW